MDIALHPHLCHGATCLSALLPFTFRRHHHHFCSHPFSLQTASPSVRSVALGLFSLPLWSGWGGDGCSIFVLSFLYFVATNKWFFTFLEYRNKRTFATPCRFSEILRSRSLDHGGCRTRSGGYHMPLGPDVPQSDEQGVHPEMSDLISKFLTKI